MGSLLTLRNSSSLSWGLGCWRERQWLVPSSAFWWTQDGAWNGGLTGEGGSSRGLQTGLTWPRGRTQPRWP